MGPKTENKIVNGENCVDDWSTEFIDDERVSTSKGVRQTRQTPRNCRGKKNSRIKNELEVVKSP